MYKQKSVIIEQIQSYHSQVALLYHETYEKLPDNEIKSLMFDLYQHEKDRESILPGIKRLLRQ